MSHGAFIVIEGIDGAGTTTQAARLCERLRASGVPTHATHEPTTGPIGALLRQALTRRFVVPGQRGSRPPSWRTMALLFAADRLDHLEAEIEPNLFDGVTVVSDRYDLSSLAYQSALADDDDASDTLDWLRAINRHARRPDLTIVVDVPAAVASQRRRRRGQAIEIYEEDPLQARLALAYERAERLVPGDRVAHVDGAQSLDRVAEAIWHLVAMLHHDRPTPD